MTRRHRVSSWLYTTLGRTAEIGYPKTSCSRFPPSQGIAVSVVSKPAAISKGLWARF